MICKNCEKGKVVMDAFSTGNCEKCNKEITTAHTPCDKICDKCSEDNLLCLECGCNIQI